LWLIVTILVCNAINIHLYADLRTIGMTPPMFELLIRGALTKTRADNIPFRHASWDNSLFVSTQTTQTTAS
jgi:hypothetical protein